MKTRKIGITDVVLRDAHQSLFATRLRLDDMLPIAKELDEIGYWSLECWGGATFDSCIRFLGEDPWVRLRELKKAIPNTPLQMLLRGQNLLGYRHYSDDVVDTFVERAVKNGMDVFRIFDAMNDTRNMQQAIASVKKMGAHAQATLSYTTSPVHTLQTWIDTAQQLNELGVNSIAIKDMAGILTPFAAEELITELKKHTDIELHLHCHSTAGLADMTLLKAIESGVDRVDTAVSSMSGTYGHPATESVVEALRNTQFDTGLDVSKIEKVSAYFREVRKKYAQFEGQLKGSDSRILVAQVPGGMLTNMESQLKQQNALDKMDLVLEEIPKVRADLGLIPLVTPTSQIVGTQAVINVILGERYKTITKETAGILKGEYGKTPAPVNTELQKKVLNSEQPITVRPADNIAPEIISLTERVLNEAQTKNIKLSDLEIEDVLIVALFEQVGWKFLENRNNPDAFEPKPELTTNKAVKSNKGKNMSDVYTVTVNQKSYVVKVDEGGDISQVQPVASTVEKVSSAPQGDHLDIHAPLAGNIWKVPVKQGQEVNEGDVLVILEAMKMETEIKAARSGVIHQIEVNEGDAVEVDDKLLILA